ncbi:hypothetical protein FB451DRAFT_1454307 [Mycena latifolia]|nr:hypothetical protein FB451DRAFT_1454307 [Mycena latifolia]
MCSGPDEKIIQPSVLRTVKPESNGAKSQATGAVKFRCTPRYPAFNPFIPPVIQVNEPLTLPRRQKIEEPFENEGNKSAFEPQRKAVAARGIRSVQVYAQKKCEHRSVGRRESHRIKVHLRPTGGVVGPAAGREAGALTQRALDEYRRSDASAADAPVRAGAGGRARAKRRMRAEGREGCPSRKHNNRNVAGFRGTAAQEGIQSRGEDQSEVRKDDDNTARPLGGRGTGKHQRHAQTVAVTKRMKSLERRWSKAFEAQAGARRIDRCRRRKS